MSEDKHLVELRTKLNAAIERRHRLNVTNTVGLTPEEQVRLDVEFDLADRAVQSARIAYDKAVDDYCERSGF